MKHIEHSLVILICVAIVAVQMTMAQRVVSAASYFPLHLGNQWSYSSRLDKITQIVTDTATIHGHFFYGMSWSGYLPSTWFRSSNDSVFVTQSRSDSSESVLYRFNANVGDTLKLLGGYGCTFGTMVILASKDDTVTVPSGTYAHCYHFRHVPDCADAGMYDSWLAERVGMVEYKVESIAGMRIFLLDSCRIVAAVKNADAGVQSGSYFLSECYPNPFNPRTTLTYRTGKSSHVSLRIFDLLGREIATPVNERKAPGTYHVVWSAAGKA